MLRLLIIVLLTGAVLASSCKRRPSVADAPLELPATLVSGFAVSDPEAAAQMTHGFHALEGNWRWVAGRFGVVLGQPEGAGQRGARLEVRLAVPETIAAKMLPVTLEATTQGTALTPETFTRPGEYVYARDLDAGLFTAGAVAVEFTTDKTIPPAGTDQRELALVVTSVRLLPR